MRAIIPLAIAGAFIAMTASASAAELVQLSSGLAYRDDVVGKGAEAKPGQKVTVHYTGWLDAGGGKKGAKFDSSRDRNQHFTFTLGAGEVIRGWDEGVMLMRPGGRRTLIVPPGLGYGDRGAGGGKIPPNSTLIFDVELFSAR